MKWKNTSLLVGSAAALFAFIFFVERRFKPSGYVAPAQTLFGDFKPTASTSLQLRRGMAFNLALERTNDSWQFSKPFTYPAADFAVESFLAMLERIVPATRISPREILARKQSVTDFGFDSPPIVITLQRGDEAPKQLRIGAKTPAGDQMYVEVDGQPGVAVVNANLLDQVPRSQHDWRASALFLLGDEKPDRVEVTQGANSYALQLDPTNKLWRLDRPRHRANQFQVQQLLGKIQLARVVEFVADLVDGKLVPPRVDEDAFGLQNPEFELTLTSGTLARKVQFGRSPTNNPGLVYARLLSHSNVVLAPRTVLEPLLVPYTELREKLILPFAPELVDIINVAAEENFEVRKEGGGWKAGDVAADPEFVMWWLLQLSQLEAQDFERDRVIDFAPYGLAPGLRQYTLRTAITNGTTVTNARIGEVVFGTNSTNMFARRMDEDSVYEVRPLDFSHMPGAAWQFREHNIWKFTTNQVVRIAVQQGDKIREVIRQPNNEWIATKGPAEINPFALEEAARGLGELRAMMWMGRGQAALAKFGFGPNNPQVTVELGGDKPQILKVEFGGRSPWLLPYAATVVDGEPYVFEFPWPLYAELQRYFGLSVAVPQTVP